LPAAEGLKYYRPMSNLLQDLRYGLRMLRKTPGFTVIALVALILGIASTTVIFSVVDGILLHSLPYPESDRILTVAQTTRSSGVSRHAASPANFLDWQAQSDLFTQMAASRGAQANLTDGDRPERVRTTATTASLFPLFGVNPILGRGLLPSDEKPGSARVTVLSHGLWQRRYGADQKIIGTEIKLDGQPHTVVGVMPPDFSPDEYGELWVASPWGVPANSLRPDEDPRQIRGSTYLDVYARLKPGVTIEQARSEMNAIALRLEQQYPNENMDVGIALVALHDEMVSGIRPMLLVLSTAVGSLLLIGCANVANLLLARAATRSKEISIRAALGASRFRIIRQLLTESVLLSLLGGVLGVLLAAWALPLLLTLSPPQIRGFKEISLNREVLGFSLAASLLTGIVFGLVPAFFASSSNPNESLRAGERGSTTSGRRGRAILITAEVALSLVLLIGAGLMVRSFDKLTRVDPGFVPDRVLIFNIGASPSADVAHQTAFFNQILESLRSVPGVDRVGAVSRLPLSGGNSNRSFNLPGSDTSYGADIRIATPDYFKAIGIPLLRGRNFSEHDTANSTHVAIVNEAMVRATFPGQDPIGKVVTNFGPANETLEIVGVVGNVRHLALETEPRAELYQPLGQASWPSLFVAAHTATSNPLMLVPAAQNAVWSVDKNVPLGNIRTMTEIVATSLMKRKFTMLLLAIFAGLAVTLAAIGLYGVMSYSVSQRTREIGIRMALGAQRRQVLRLVVKQGMTLTAIGVVLGIAASLGLTRLMANLLFGVSATDSLTFLGLSVVLLAVALLACWLPARRASGVDPMVALRAE
jgi:putative ABC transport system permease protein